MHYSFKLKDVLSQMDFCKSTSVWKSNGKMIIGPLFYGGNIFDLKLVLLLF